MTGPRTARGGDGVRVVFISHAEDDPEVDDDTLAIIRDWLDKEIWQQTGRPEIAVLWDRRSASWSRAWKNCIEASGGATGFLLPLLTPAYFADPACREELASFLRWERALERQDLILPLYWASTPVVDRPESRGLDPTAGEMLRRQPVDVRDHRPVSLGPLAGRVGVALKPDGGDRDPGAFTVVVADSYAAAREIAERFVTARRWCSTCVRRTTTTGNDSFPLPRAPRWRCAADLRELLTTF